MQDVLESNTAQRDEIIQDNLKLVHHICNKYKSAGKRVGLEYDDLFSSGCIGLMKAAERFDVSYGVQFATYAVPLILGEIRRVIRDSNTGAYYTRPVKNAFNLISKNDLWDLNDDEIAERLEINVEYVTAAKQMACGAVSMDKTMNDSEEKEIHLSDMIGYDFDDTTAIVNDFIESLEQRDRLIIAGVIEGKTQWDIAHELGVAQTQVSRWIKSIRNKWMEYEAGKEIPKMRAAKGDMKRAKELILNTDMTPEDIANKTGTNLTTIKLYTQQMRSKKESKTHIEVNVSVPKVEGVGKDEPITVNERGGKQSKLPYRFDLVDAPAMFKMTKVLAEGAEKYGDSNWRNIDIKDHLNHLIVHAYAYLAGDRSDDHLAHALCRAMFAQAVELEGQAQ